MTIRAYTAADRDGCMAAFRSNMPQYFLPEELADYQNWLQHLDSAVRNSDGKIADHYFVVEEAGEITGCGGCSIYFEKNEAVMTWGMVARHLHKRGIGRALFLHRMEAIRHSCATCVIKLDTTQFSYPFFEQFGFVVQKITPDGYGPGMHRYDMACMPG